MTRHPAELRLHLLRRVLDLPEDRLVELEMWLAEADGNGSKKFQSSVEPEHSQRAEHSKAWPHAPVHRVSEHGTYIVTAATLHKAHLFRDESRLDLLEAKLLELAAEHGWHLEAWAVFSNHYHFVGHSHEESSSLKAFLSHVHTVTATELNQLERQAERQVWHNFWETRLTYEKSYLARLNYVHQNAVHHGLVPVANQYHWCSAAWFERTATRAQVATIYSFKLDKLKVLDDFDIPHFGSAGA